MDKRGPRSAPTSRAGDRDSAGPSATEGHSDGSDEHRHSPGSAAAKWRTEGLDFVRDAIRLSYQ